MIQKDDTLNCGECKRSFPLRDITLFFQHKIEQCQENSPVDEDIEDTVKSCILACSKCEKKFRDARRLLEHIEYHHHQNIFIDICCPEKTKHSPSTLCCGKIEIDDEENSNDISQTSNGISLIEKNQLKMNEKDVKQNIKRFQCDKCEYEAFQRIHLRKHISTKHTNSKPYKCTNCPYSTVEKSHLRVHYRIHTGERPFKCNYCQYRSAQNGALKSHVKRKHKEKF
ncbi:hypothetical protein SNEBB_004585 [Seison nebaliae]|nr:hypothetical protein SNEBB_004585 [Seison nebaliae]